MAATALSTAGPGIPAALLACARPSPTRSEAAVRSWGPHSPARVYPLRLPGDWAARPRPAHRGGPGPGAGPTQRGRRTEGTCARGGLPHRPLRKRNRRESPGTSLPCGSSPPEIPCQRPQPKDTADLTFFSPQTNFNCVWEILISDSPRQTLACPLNHPKQK
jgi:hypothetical protein